MKALDLEPLSISGAALVKHDRRGDERGHLERLFDAQELSTLLGGRTIAQANRTYTRNLGTIRGMHCQLPPHSEAKIVQCLRGAVFDVLVDVREESPTFGHWFGCELSGESNISLLIPEGCAHGLQTLTQHAEMLYLHTAPYAPEAEAGLNPLDPVLAINWPLPITAMSARDRAEVRNPAWFKGVQW